MQIKTSFVVILIEMNILHIACVSKDNQILTEKSYTNKLLKKWILECSNLKIHFYTHSISKINFEL